MKKFLSVSFLLAILFANFSFGNLVMQQQNVPVTKEDIWAYQIIKRNADANNLADPDKIWPNQYLYYFLPDGSDTTTLIARGDNQTKVVKRIIEEKNLTELWSRKTPSLPVLPENDEPAKKWMSEITKDLSWLLYFIVVLFFLLFLFFIYNEISKKNRNSKNYAVTAGPAQVPGGVNDQGAYGRLNQIIASRFSNDARQRPRNVRRVNVNGTFKVYYAGAPLWWKMIHGSNPYFKIVNIKDPIVAYAGEITVGEREQTIYFLQECGNDAVQGNYMVNESNPFFINADGSPSSSNATQEVFEKDSASPEQIAEAKKSLEEKAKTEKVEKLNEVNGSESFQVNMKMLGILEGEVSKNDIHDLSMKSSPDGSFDVKIVYFDPNIKGQKSQKTDDKTEKTEGKEK